MTLYCLQWLANMSNMSAWNFMLTSGNVSSGFWHIFFRKCFIRQPFFSRFLSDKCFKASLVQAEENSITGKMLENLEKIFEFLQEIHYQTCYYLSHTTTVNYKFFQNLNMYPVTKFALLVLATQLKRVASCCLLWALRWICGHI